MILNVYLNLILMFKMTLKVYGEEVVVVRSKKALERRYIKGEVDDRSYRLASGFIRAWELMNENYSSADLSFERKEKPFPFELVRPIDNIGGRILIRKR